MLMRVLWNFVTEVEVGWSKTFDDVCIRLNTIPQRGQTENFALCMLAHARRAITINSAIADKPRDVFVQYAMAWPTP